MSYEENSQSSFLAYAEKDRRCKTPCDNPESTWFCSEHLLDIVADSFDTVEPRYGDRFEEDRDDDRIEC